MGREKPRWTDGAGPLIGLLEIAPTKRGQTTRLPRILQTNSDTPWSSPLISASVKFFGPLAVAARSRYNRLQIATRPRHDPISLKVLDEHRSELLGLTRHPAWHRGAAARLATGA